MLYVLKCIVELDDRRRILFFRRDRVINADRREAAPGQDFHIIVDIIFVARYPSAAMHPDYGGTRLISLGRVEDIKVRVVVALTVLLVFYLCNVARDIFL